MKKILGFTLASALMAFAAMTPADNATHQIQFAKGKTSASVSGKITGNDSIDYQLRASAGQTMSVDFKASKGAAYFQCLATRQQWRALSLSVPWLAIIFKASYQRIWGLHPAGLSHGRRQGWRQNR